MATTVYKMIELVGTSPKSIEEAVNNALASKAAAQPAAQRWFEVLETRGAIKDGQVTQWQVTIKVGLAEE